MNYRHMSARARTTRNLCAGLAVAFFTTLMVTQAPAQTSQNKSRAPSKAQPAKPAPAAPAPPAATQPQLIFSPWVKLCNKDPDPKAKRVCVTVKDGRVESGLLVVSVAIIEMDGEPKKLLRMSLPYGVALQHGTRLIVDQGTPHTAPFVTCLPPVVPPGGCISDYEATPELIKEMKKAQVVTVQAIHMNGQAMSPQLDLKDFAKAYDGPPTDPKVFEAQQKKLQEELQKRAEEARKRLESQQPQAGSAAPKK
jgi:invasion protein IalB